MKPEEIQRVTRSKEQARESYNSMSRWYDLFTRSEKHLTDISIQMLAVQPHESILEIGCGTGHTLVEFADKIESGKIIAMDISEGMLKVARKRIQTNTRKRCVEFCQGDGLFIPFPNEQFDSVILSFTLELFDTPEIPRVLNECHRVLKVGGRLGVVALAKQETTAVHIYEWFHRRIPGLVDCRPIYLQECSKGAGYIIQISKLETMWGLPVEIVVARK